MSQDINTKEIYDCEGCRDWEGKFSRTFNQLLKKDREIGALKLKVDNLVKSVIDEKEPLYKEIASLQQQLTEAQGKSGKVVSVGEMAKVVWKYLEQTEMGKKMNGMVDCIELATAIFKALYGEGEDDGN
jgi:predicted RNase H-like nuclease (RuvC/YqgF family)